MMIIFFFTKLMDNPCLYMHVFVCRSEMELARWVEGLISKTRPHSITDFLKSIEKSESKGDFKLGLEARSEKNIYKCDININQVHVA